MPDDDPDGTIRETAGLLFEKYTQRNGLPAWRVINLEPPPRQKSKRPGAVGTIYFIGDGSAVKIGITHGHVNSRLAGLQTGSARRLFVLASMPGTIADEADLHDRFKAIRLEGEWFTASSELLAFIEEIKSK